MTEEIRAGKSKEIDLKGVEDRIYGALLAAACANSLGASCIGLSRKEILISTGLSSLRNFSPGLSRSKLPEHKPGNVLADTLLVLNFAESLIANNGQFSAIDWKDRLKKLLEDKAFLASNPRALSLAFMRKTVDGLPSIVEEHEYTDVSSAISAFPSGCLPGPPKTSASVALAIEQSTTSHFDKRVQAAAAVIADSIHFFVLGQNLASETAVRSYVGRELGVAQTIDQRFADAWDGIAPDLDYTKPDQELPYSLINAEPTVTELVPTAVGIFLLYRHSLEEAICTAALSGGDTDTVSTIVGALSGAYHGAGKIPQRWLDDLANKDHIENIAKKLCQFWY
jgi:ADP-ribosylglycohydrolase